ncbi:MAG: alpha/beta fold hydrolase [Planctomycetes bacterium]|nr:alpha/beta fold hydrolase [Planctomycetota bacterium]
MSRPLIDTLRLSDGYHARARWWRPPNPRGAVLYFHGIQSHGDWYEASASKLADAGFTVLLPDRRGSGLNQRDRGHVDSVERAVNDANDALNSLLAETHQSSAHVVGVSWGGKLAVCLASQLPQKIASLSLIAPGLFPRVDLTTAEKFRVGLSLLNDPDRIFDIPLNSPEFFTANPERIRYVNNDPLMLRQVTARFLLATRRMDRIVARFKTSGYNRPIHLMLAGHDRVIHNDPTRNWLRALPIAGVKVSDYPDAHHTLEFEPDPAPFIHDLTSWITSL